MKYYNLVFILFITLIVTACSQSKQEYFPPQENELPKVPNCAADGCQQFNPNL